ncbi:MAG: Sua5/YciO/YrdC/YwlC family protein, partial [Phycisphaerales bacterium]|nr:Sua5/YciO/YrdC/YwlC family protein [Phycisphaerales bacterium]
MLERWAILVAGVVQGVGYRPFVYGAAKELGVRGWVRNEVGGVRIEAEAERAVLEGFVGRLRVGPGLAKVEEVRWERMAIVGELGFEIRTSGTEEGAGVVVTPDAGICEECLRELFDPRNRRFRYPFINCTNCGPRLTIVTGAPYDRAKTTMAGFVMCEECRREYEDPSDRRFHAQPVACAKCGPRLIVMDGKGKILEGDGIDIVCGVLKSGGIAAIKGIGGFHLACDATNPAAVAELRRRKLRDEKPFAVMVGNLAAAEAMCEISAEERKVLMGWRRPIVLLRRREGSGRGKLADEVAPGNPFVGVMVAYTPLHALIFERLETRSQKSEDDCLKVGLRRVLVMTSGNRADEPMAYEDGEAVERLGGIADVILGHDRAIHTRCDDSVVRVFSGGGENLIRRSRGYAPEPIGLPMECKQKVLAVGGQLKGTFALGGGGGEAERGAHRQLGGGARDMVGRAPRGSVGGYG